MQNDQLCYLTIAEAASALSKRAVSSVDLTEACLARIDSNRQSASQFYHVDRRSCPGTSATSGSGAEVGERSRDVTRDSDRAQRSLPDKRDSHDLPFGGFRKLASRSRCRSGNETCRCGNRTLGKLGMHEFAFGGPSVDAPFPAVRNPWNTAHIPGGSSSGSGAALAAGLCYGALGSDTGGSIRTPASHCGVVGIKPTYGRVSRYGVIPLSWSLDHAGPMARSVEDCALLLQAIAGHDPRDPACADVAVPDFRADTQRWHSGSAHRRTAYGLV